jgi:hypothetical protein
MLQAPQRTALSGPALVRLLARLADVEVVESRQSLSDRLSQWLSWTDAIALSSALNGNPPAVAAGKRAFGRAEEDECARVRASLVKAIAGDSVFAATRRRGQAPSSVHNVALNAPVDYAEFRQRYLVIQQSMETGVGNLRGRLRGMLAAKTPAMARLAVVDAVMERALSERERNLLAAIPGLLGRHFERLREAAQKRLVEESDGAQGDHGGEGGEVNVAGDVSGVGGDATMDGSAKVSANDDANANVTVSAKADAGMDARAKAEVKAGANAGAKADTKADASADAKADAKADVNEDANATINADASASAKAAVNPAARPSRNTAPLTPNAWLDIFRKDMQSVLLAELDVRLQPVEGLLAALRTR